MLFTFSLKGVGVPDADNDGMLVPKAYTIPDWDIIPVKAIHRIFQDSDGYMWYGTFGGLFRYDGYNYKSYRSDFKHKNLFDNNYITYINEDLHDHIWIGTMSGLYRLDKRTDKVQKVELGGSFSSENIFTISVTKDGKIWVSVIGNLFVLNEEGEILNVYQIPDNSSVYFVYETLDGELIISADHHQGMSILNRETDTFEPYYHNSRYGLIEKMIWDEEHQCYWLACYQSGVVRFRPASSEVSRSSRCSRGSRSSRSSRG